MYSYSGTNLLFASQGQAGGTTWGAAAVVDSVPAPGYLQFPALTAVPVTGDVPAVWQHKDNASSDSYIESAYLSAGSGTWSASTILNATQGAGHGPFSLGASPDGSLAAVSWIGYVRSRRRVSSYYVAAQNPGTHQWAAPASLSTLGLLQFGPVLTFGPSGTMTAVWEDYISPDYYVRAATYQ